MSLVWKRSFGEPGAAPRPVHLYGYGSYEHSIEPGFSVPRLSLLDRGVVFAVAHVRGGGEMGRQWYEDGKMRAKRNTFTDFVAAARHLVDAGYTTPDRIVAEGGSAGGLLMGAVANLAPELFAAGVRRVNVSLDSLDEAKFAAITRRGRLADVLGGIDAAADAGLRVKINAVALREE